MSFDQAGILILPTEILIPNKSTVIYFFWNAIDYFKTLDSKMWLLGPELTSDGEDKCAEEPEYNCTKSWQEQ